MKLHLIFFNIIFMNKPGRNVYHVDLGDHLGSTLRKKTSETEKSVEQKLSFQKEGSIL